MDAAAEYPRKSKADSYATVMIGVFCTLGSMVYVSQLPFQYPFAHQAQVAALATKVKENTAQTEVVKQQAVTAAVVAVKAQKVATRVRNEDVTACIKGQEQTDRRVAQLRRELNQVKKRLGMP